MMNFRIVNQAIINILGAAADSRFKVVGYAGQGSDVSEFKGNSRTVQSYYTFGSFAKSSGRQCGTTQHGMTFTIGLTCSSPARVNLAVLTQEGATAGQRAAALAAKQDADYLADLAIDELFEMVYQILMDARNVDLGLSKGTVTGRWIGEMQKDPPVPQGELVTVTGTVTFTCSTDETVTGDPGTPVEPGGGITVNIDIVGDDTERTGVITGGV